MPDAGILLDVLSCNSNIAGSEVIDTYLLNGKKSITYRISILADKEPDNVQADV
jgi:hypothetical protein